MREYTVDILGTPYQIHVIPTKMDPLLKDNDGYCDRTSKRIVVDDCTGCGCDYDKPEEYVNKVIRHEIVHAFLFESGLAEGWMHQKNGQEEITVDWIAIMAPKLHLAFKQAEAV